MLILAGVSLNAIIGDNGVINQAQNTTILSSCAILEEFFNEEYLDLCGKQEGRNDEKNKIKLFLNDNYKKNYIQKALNDKYYFIDIESGTMNYFINKNSLPDEIKKQVKGGENNLSNTIWANFDDIYGITSDLQVYYGGSNGEVVGGDKETQLADLNEVISGMGSGSAFANTLGYPSGVSTNNAIKTRDMTITDSNTELSLMYNFVNLTTMTIDGVNKTDLVGLDGASNINDLVIKNSTIGSLHGIENLKKLKRIVLMDCNISNYLAISSLTQIEKLYIIKPVGKNEEITTFCSKDRGIGKAKLSKLAYFGITGTDSYIERIDNNYSSAAQYEITDISPLANLQTETKNAVKHLYLHNLQLSSMSAVEGFTGVLDIRVDRNCLSDLNGIQNMSNLAYLIANNCFDNTIETEDKHSLGMNEGDNPDASSDALSYIYKYTNSSNKVVNSTLYYVSLRGNTKLKYVNYLSNCTNLRQIYLDGCSNIANISSISDNLALCGSNYLIPDGMSGALISPNFDKINLTGETITKADFENILPKDNNGNPTFNTKLTKLSLRNTKIVNNNKSEMNNTELTTLLNNVLSKCSSMVYLQLDGQAGLTNINFVSSMINLRELDLNNCSGVNDLSILETMTNETIAKENDDNPNNDSGNFKLGVLYLNNNSLILTDIQNTISRLGSYGGYWYNDWGLIISNSTLLAKLNNCSNISKLVCSRSWNSTSPSLDCDINISSCSKLENVSFYNYKVGFTFPSSLKYYSTSWSSRTRNFSNCSNLISYKVGNGLSPTYLYAEIASLPSVLNCFEEFSYNGKDNVYNLNFLSKFENCSTFKSFSWTEQDDWTPNMLTDISGLSYLKHCDKITIRLKSKNTTAVSFPNLTNVNASVELNGKNFSDLTNVATCGKITALKIANSNLTDLEAFSSLTQLVSLEVCGNPIEDISDINELTSLELLNISGCKVDDLSVLKYLTSLNYADLRNNFIDVGFYYKENDITKYESDTLTFLVNVFKNKEKRTLYIKGNKITDYTKLRTITWTNKDF